MNYKSSFWIMEIQKRKRILVYLKTERWILDMDFSPFSSTINLQLKEPRKLKLCMPSYIYIYIIILSSPPPHPSPYNNPILNTVTMWTIEFVKCQLVKPIVSVTNKYKGFLEGRDANFRHQDIKKKKTLVFLLL